ncbi:MAG: TrbG/VirB9 family P-type conjugative transfer protein, partial [Novosphingobium sp.]
MIPLLPNRRLLVPALLLAIASPAFAQNEGGREAVQEGPPQDARVATRDYVENRVVSFSARAGFQSTIEFGDGERIENVAVGESAAWQVTPNRRANLLFIKPVAATAPVTNMTVVTDRHTYLFELRPAARATPVYLLRFTYAEDLSAPPALPPEAATLPLIPAVQTRDLPVNDLNFAWTMKGTRKLYPERVFDDGKSVYLAWAQGRALPAVLSIGPDGKTEGPVNFTADGQYLVVEGFHNRLVLRSGADVATIETSRTAPAEAS